MAIKRLNVASEDTLQGVKSDVADVKTDVAGVKVDVANVNSNIGGTADTGGSSSEGTSMAKLNYLIESIKNVLNSTAGTAGLKTLDKIIEEKVNSAVSKITANGGIKVVKSVQRGVVQPALKATVTINSINVNKSIVILNGTWEGDSSYEYTLPILSNLTSTSLKIFNSYDNDDGRRASAFFVSWQVIEFY